MAEKKDDRRLYHFRLRNDEEEVIVKWLANQENVAGAFRYLIKKESAVHGVQDISGKVGTRSTEEQILNEIYNDIAHVLPKLKDEQKMMLLFKLQSECGQMLSDHQQIFAPQPLPINNNPTSHPSVVTTSKIPEQEMGENLQNIKETLEEKPPIETKTEGHPISALKEQQQPQLPTETKNNQEHESNVKSNAVPQPEMNEPLSEVIEKEEAPREVQTNKPAKRKKKDKSGLVNFMLDR